MVKINDKYYCRKCLAFKRLEIGQELDILDVYYENNNSYYELSYELSQRQKEISEQLILNCQDNVTSLVWAVCGSGKTEICLEVIKKYLNDNKKVGFVIPRKDVVIELGERFASLFKNIEITIVYGGHNNELKGQFVILTAHQAFRYYQYFDLVIIDEFDAFPYAGNDLIIKAVEKCNKGPFIYLSATPPQYVLNDKNIKILKLFRRYHGYDLVMPKVVYGFYYYLLFILKKWIKANSQFPLLIFVPDIKLGHKLSKILGIDFVYSYCEKRYQLVNEFKNSKNGKLLSTTILERGITKAYLKVAIFQAEKFNEAALMQMMGRVGRKIEDPIGEVLLLCLRRALIIEKCLKEIVMINKSA